MKLIDLLEYIYNNLKKIQSLMQLNYKKKLIKIFEEKEVSIEGSSRSKRESSHYVFVEQILLFLSQLFGDEELSVEWISQSERNKIQPFLSFQKEQSFLVYTIVKWIFPLLSIYLLSDYLFKTFT